MGVDFYIIGDRGEEHGKRDIYISTNKRIPIFSYLTCHLPFDISTASLKGHMGEWSSIRERLYAYKKQLYFLVIITLIFIFLLPFAALRLSFRCIASNARSTWERFVQV